MPKMKTHYVCQACGHTMLKWQGQCPACEQWNTLVAEAVPDRPAQRLESGDSAAVALPDISMKSAERRSTGIAEFDRIVGGGFVPGQVGLVGGDPGIGKSTILLQIAQALATPEQPVLYVSGEESATQTKLRAQRLQVSNPQILVLAEANLGAILAEIERRQPSVVMIDSIQVMFKEDVPSAPGSVTQVRECAAELARLAKRTNCIVLLVGHVTKAGAIAGPRVVEHLVDTVLYFEGDRHTIYRMLRAVKNRFGSTDEIGVFEMTGNGLMEVPNPSALFLAQRQKQRSGSVVGSALEGTRPLLLEVQALVTTTPFGMPSRRAVGVDPNRVTMLLAVMEKRVGLQLHTQDVFVNLAGGMRVTEPGLDLACVSAIASSFYDRAVPDDTVIIGEVGLGGEIRAVNQIERRVMEAKRLGFKQCIIPAHNLKAFRERGAAHLVWQGVELIGCKDVTSAIQQLLGPHEAAS